ncbi:hypothetical protein CYMTET_24767 [Cymbomonas tetramitiformis]|uniref:Uncharacterized protein n=1 Tax=Cymbomonas tetramitiformis TaxID=36881 RepID=A0AAE0KZW8_9CHLO|nr:hypothetical protein CYMTET_24767 [Cymbomonas tetramitiformis]
MLLPPLLSLLGPSCSFGFEGHVYCQSTDTRTGTEACLPSHPQPKQPRLLSPSPKSKVESTPKLTALLSEVDTTINNVLKALREPPKPPPHRRVTSKTDLTEPAKGGRVVLDPDPERSQQMDLENHHLKAELVAVDRRYKKELMAKSRWMANMQVVEEHMQALVRASKMRTEQLKQRHTVTSLPAAPSPRIVRPAITQ